MAQFEWTTFRRTDADVIKSFDVLAEQLAAPITLHVRLPFQGNYPTIDIPLSEARTHATARLLIESQEVMAYVLIAKIANGLSLELTRVNDRATDLAKLHFRDDFDSQRLIHSLASIKAQFPTFDRTESVDRILGPDIANFYNTRDVALTRLERLAESVIEKTEEYRRKLDSQADEKDRRRDELLDKQTDELGKAHQDRLTALNEREKELDERQASLDDRQSRHARRQLRQDLQTVLRAHSEKFSLTEDTARKRGIVHLLFAVLILATAAYIGLTTFETWDQTYDWTTAVRLAVGFGGLAAEFFLYIRWNDTWFRQHADEEFRLKRMSLDIDRASWVVETAMEWQHENKQSIPDHLLAQLTRELFARDQSVQPIKHPAEELAAVLAGASSLRVQLPFGEATLDRKGIQKAAERMEGKE